MKVDLHKLDAILAVIAEIPAGKVATYGQIAALAHLPGRARLVGRALRGLPAESGIPWHRVLNAKGEISLRGSGESCTEQHLLLQDEGIAFDQRGRVSLDRYLWQP